MDRRKLGNSGIEVGPIGIGCWAYGGGDYWGAQDQRDVNDVVHAALEHGANFFDTAEMYNDGASEIALGQALKGRRGDAVICSKLSPSNAYPTEIKMHLTCSLKRLGIDYLDIYMLHWPISPISLKHFTKNQDVIDNPPSVQDAFDTLMALRREGLIREIAISNFGYAQINEALATGATLIANEMPYNILSRAIEKEILPLCVQKNIAVIGSMTLQQGLLAGLFAEASDVPPHQAHSRHFKNERGRGTSRHNEQGAEAEVFDAVAKVRTIAQDIGVHMAQLSIAWVLAKRGMQCALVGSRNIKELEQNLKAGEIALSDQVIAMLDLAGAPVLEKLGSNPDYYENSANSRIK